MLFHTPEFILLLIVTLGLYAAVPRARLPILAVSAIIFYVVSGWKYLLLFLGMSALTQACAVRARGDHGRVFLWLGVAVNLANLLLFKYTAFAAGQLERLLNLGINPRLLQLALPVGISFYTFQMIAYLVDVHQGKSKPARSLLEFWVFIAFFGHLIAGPIMRGEEFLPQIQEAQDKQLRWSRLQHGLYLFALGMTKKVLLSDILAPKVDALFAQAATLGGLEAWIAGWLFAFQIYYDFSAYSEMALGIGHFFGFELAVNFRTPYLSRNSEEFWRRWHITLSSWIRDYIYIPLGGSRRGEIRAYLNLFLAMVISGLWHGAAMTFVIWGAFHGLLSALHKLWSRRVLKPLGWRLDGLVVRWISIVLMFQAATVGWIFFRATDLAQATVMLRAMFAPSLLRMTPLATRYLPVIAVLALLHVGEFWLRHREDDLAAAWLRWFPSPARALAYTAWAAVLILMTRLEESSFIYFRF